MNNIQKQMQELNQKLKQWNYEYYELNNPSVDDYTYDITLKQLQDLEKQYPQFILANSVTKEVYKLAKQNQFNKVTHSSKMLSLANSYNLAEITNFVNNVYETLNTTEIDFVCEPKIDGLSISCMYEDGNLKIASTRGNGEVGEDVTVNVKTILDIPKTITLKDEFEARGEIYLAKSVLAELNQTANFANTRNAASGALRNLDPNVTKSRKLNSWFYFIPDQFNTNQTHYESLQQLNSLNFSVALDYIKIAKNIDEIMNYIVWFDKVRANLNFDVDGVVIKVNQLKYYDLLGTTSKYPKYAIAYKYPPTIAQTKLIDILLNVGRTGKITFTAALEPVKINGSVISFATLHNLDYIHDRDIRINDIVNIYKAAEVIPKISNPVLTLRPNNAIKYEFNYLCPSCKSKVIQFANEVDYYCINEDCQEKQIQQLIYFCSKSALDIANLNESTIRKFYEYGWVRKITDFYFLKDHYDEIINADLKIKNKMLDKILKNIEDSKTKPLANWLSALNIRFVALATSKLLLQSFQSLNDLMNAQIIDLININGIGEKIANSIYEFFHNEDNLKLIQQLIDAGVRFTNNTNVEFKGTFCITGSFTKSRDEIIKMYEEQGYKFTNSVTKNLSFLLVGQNPGSKLQKAIDLNILIKKDAI